MKRRIREGGKNGKMDGWKLVPRHKKEEEREKKGRCVDGRIKMRGRKRRGRERGGEGKGSKKIEQEKLNSCVLNMDLTISFSSLSSSLQFLREVE